MENKYNVVKNTFDSMNVFWGTKQVGEFIRDLDGYYVFFPTDLDGEMYSKGGWTSSCLRFLSDELDKVNKEWENTISMFFGKKFIAEQFELPLGLDKLPR